MNPQSFEAILEAWNDAQMRHAMVIHLPIVLSLIAAIVGIGVAVRPRNGWLRGVCLTVIALLAASSWLASGSGQGAEASIEQVLSPAASQNLDTHEDMGVLVWLFACVAGGTALLTLVPNPNPNANDPVEKLIHAKSSSQCERYRVT